MKNCKGKHTHNHPDRVFPVIFISIIFRDQIVQVKVNKKNKHTASKE